MRTLLWLCVGAGALMLHELLLKPAGSRTAFRFLRWGLLLLLAVAAAAAGPSVLARLEQLTTSSPAPVIPFDSATGDPLGTHALEGQRPRQPFPAGEPAAAADAWRGSVLERLRTEAGLEIDRAEQVPFETVRSEQLEGLRRTLIRFTSWDGTRVPAYVFEPDAASRKGGVLVVPGHGAGIAATAGLADDYQHAAALELARAGYVTLTPELRGFGLLSPSGVASHRVVAAAALASGSSYKALVIRDLSRALTVLASWRQVDSTRLGVVGTSLGGELAVLLAGLDPRVRATVSNSYGGVVGADGEVDSVTDESRQTPHGCHTVPGINRIVMQEDWARLVSPRPLLMVRGTNNHPASTEEFRKLIASSYASAGAADRFDVALEQGAHEFYLEPTVRFLRRFL